MRALALILALGFIGAAHAAADYPPGLFEHSPDVSDPHSKRWTHLPDGRWMMVDPNQPTGKSCDFQNHCYPDAGAPPSPAEPQGQAPSIPDALMPAQPAPGVGEAPEAEAMPPGAFGTYRDLGEPPPNATSSLDPVCDELRHRLFRNLVEVYRARQRCGP